MPYIHKKNSLPLFSVVIPTYNRYPKLCKALNSVSNQTLQNYELIVVDDGSSDSTWSYLSENSDWIIAIRQPNAGAAAARNEGVAHARGTFIVFLDSDDVLAPYALMKYAEVIQRFSDVNAILGSCTTHDFIEHPLNYKLFSDPSEAYAQGHRWGTACCLRRETLIGVGGFDRMLKVYEDQELILRFPRHCGAAVIEVPALYRYVTGRDSLTRNIDWTYESLGLFVARANLVSRLHNDLRIKERVAETARGVAIALAKQGHFKLAMVLWTRSLPENLFFHRWRFIVGMPLLALIRGILKIARRH